LVVEIDGSVHDVEGQKAIDEHRTKVFADRGLREIRFRNEEVLHDMPSVIQRISEHRSPSKIGANVPG
jgi:very-short-patch-repair endonuclease